MGWTALMCACRNDHIEVAKLLVSKGADVNLVDGANKSALQRAQAQQKTNIVAFLQSAGYFPPPPHTSSLFNSLLSILVSLVPYLPSHDVYMPSFRDTLPCFASYGPNIHTISHLFIFLPFSLQVLSTIIVLVHVSVKIFGICP